MSEHNAERQRLLAKIAALKQEEEEDNRPAPVKRAKGPSVGRIPWKPHIDAETRARFMPRDHRPLNAEEAEVAGLQRLIVGLHGDAGEALQKERKRDHRGWVEVKEPWEKA